MLDTQLFRKDLSNTIKKLRTRGFDFDEARYEQLETMRKSLQIETEALRSERNTSSKKIGQAKSRGEDVALLLESQSELGAKLKTKEQELVQVQEKLQDLLYAVPNLPHETVPIGLDETENKEISLWGENIQVERGCR